MLHSYTDPVAKLLTYSGVDVSERLFLIRSISASVDECATTAP
jgi:hypothetical protein